MSPTKYEEKKRTKKKEARSLVEFDPRIVNTIEMPLARKLIRLNRIGRADLLNVCC